MFLKTFILNAALLVLLLATVALCAAQNALAVTKIEPPNCWIGHSINPVRVLIRGQNLTGRGSKRLAAGLMAGLTRINGAGT